MIHPRIFHEPPEISFSLGDEAIELAAMTGLNLFDWEKHVLRKSLGVRPSDDKWAAFEVGLIVSRQNGKGSILEARELAGLFVLGERLIIHSAHQFDTSLEAFNRIMERIESCPDLDNQVSRVSRSHGEEGVELKADKRTGERQRLRFRTRTKGGGRGFTCDCLILDEAMYLGSQMVGALLPTVSARPNAQIYYTGSAGDRESTQLGLVRERGIAGNDSSLVFMEYSINHCNDFCDPKTKWFDCPDHDCVSDPKAWAKANPSMGLIISQEHIEREYRSMPFEVFLQERLGVGDWPKIGDAWRVISETYWSARASDIEQPHVPFTFALDVNPERTWSCITSTGTSDNGVSTEITQGEFLDYRPGTSWLVDRCDELNKRWKPKGFILDSAGQAGAFKDDLEDRGINVVCPTSREYAQACGKTYSALVPSRNNVPYLWHRDQVDLNNAVRGADKRKLSGLWAWDRTSSSVDISPLVCVTLGLWGHEKFALEKTSHVAMAWG